jgi:hypothetical protein
VFKALADPTRRLLLDKLFERDCRTLTGLEVDPPRRLVQSFRALWGEDVVAEGTSRVTWEIEPVAGSCCLTVT